MAKTGHIIANIESDLIVTMQSAQTLRSQLRSVSPPARAPRKKRRLDEPVDTSIASADPVNFQVDARALKGENVLDAAGTRARSPTRSDGSAQPSPALVEAGRGYVDNYLEYYTGHFTEIRRRRALKQSSSSTFISPPLSISSFSRLYSEQAGSSRGHHFVIQQHDHPLAGLHYDLRLQFSETSSASWAVNKGLPGNPNESQNHGRRQAIETRVHPLWTHLNESASQRSGSQFIWDTGTYEVLPYREDDKSQMTDDEDELDDEEAPKVLKSESEKFQEAFKANRIRVRLHGSRLPPGYTIRMRYSGSTETSIRQGLGLAPRTTNSPQRKATRANKTKHHRNFPDSDPDSEESDVKSNPGAPEAKHDAVSDDEQPDAVDEWIKRNNAYPGSSNTIGSVRGRSWVIYLDHRSCGFRKKRTSEGTMWHASSAETGRSYPLVVRGRDFERSIVTGRLARDVQEDEGVRGYVPKAGWNPILR